MERAVTRWSRLRRPVSWGLAGAVAIGSYCAPGALRQLRAVGVLLGAIGVEDPSGLTRWVMRPVQPGQEQTLELGGRHVRALSYQPVGKRGAPGIVLLHGIHHLGIDEPRFCRMARALAGAGFHVLTPELAELHDYRIEPASIDTIAGCVRLHARATSGKVGAWGISFAGGLLLLAATRPGVQDDLAYAVTVGSHSDLTRVIQYYAGEVVRDPQGAAPLVAPHPYGARVLLHAYVERFFSGASVPLARRALRAYVEDRFEAARRDAAQLPADDRQRLQRLIDGDAGAIAHELKHVAADHAAELAAVSPRGRLRELRTPTFLLHGLEDSVIPSLETRHLADDVPRAALRRVLVTPVLGHADLSQQLPWRVYLELVQFTAAVLAANGS